MKTNMKSIIYKGACLLFTAATLTSCDVLDLDPLDSYTEPLIFSDPTLTEAYVTKFYTYPANGFSGESLACFTDEAMYNFNNNWTIQRDGYTPDNLGYFNNWKSTYTNIKNINIFFNNMENVEKIPEPTKSTLIGEATFFRAFFYMDLISRYGGVPLITKTFELDDPEMMVPRNTYDECAKFVVDEFTKAANLLPLSQKGKNLGRLTKGAALAYKARMLLYMASPLNNPNNDRAKWQAVSDACDEFFALNQYSLDPSYKNVFWDRTSPEIIFQRIYDTEHGHWFNWYNTPNGFPGWSATCVTQEMVDSYEMEDGSMFDVTPYADENNPCAVNPWENRDPRFYVTVACDGQKYRTRELEYWINEDGKTGGQDSEYSSSEAWNYSKSHYSLRKFADESLTSSYGQRASNSWIYCRLAEVYLTYAEAKCMLGDDATARIYVNKVRERARGGKAGILPDVTESGDALLKKIQHERKVELAFEDQRWFDMRRWKIAKDVMTNQFHGIVIIRKADGSKVYHLKDLFKATYDDKLYLVPIPQTERNKNNLLEQNPGY